MAKVPAFANTFAGRRSLTDRRTAGYNLPFISKLD